MLDIVLVASGGVALVVATFFVHLERWSVTPALLGLATGIILGPQLTGVLTIPAQDEVHVLYVAARLLLAVALMGIALRYPTRTVRARAGEVAVLLVVVLPVMAAVVAAGAMWTLGLPLGMAAVIGAALSPTDPVLASGIVTGEFAERDVPARSRQALSLESGANDGLAQPLVVLAIAVALDRPMSAAVGTAIYEVVVALGLGVAAGTASGWALRWAEAHREVSRSVRSFYTLVLAALLLGASGLLRVDGLLSVFVAGLAHGRVVTVGDRESEVAVDEALNQFLIIPVFVLLGVALPWSGWAQLGWGGLGFVAVVLVLRRLPITLVLRRPLRASWAHVAWLGWFGPIGVAALFFVGHADRAGVTDPRIWAASTLVIAASTVLHGVTGAPARAAYRERR